ncbi:MAG: Ig-like domain-containing protein [Methanobrevibacter smithii]
MLGSVCAADLNNVSDIENSNLIQDDNQLSYQNLEVSSNGSISDNYSYNFNGEYSGSGVIKSNYENNNVIGSQQISNNVVISEPQSSVSNTTLSGNDTTLYFKNGTSYNVKLTDIDGNVLTNQTVSFLINGKLYNRTTGSNGIASININLGAGKYTVVASYAGSSMYGSSSVTSLVEVLSTISANDVVKFYKNGTQYYAKFVDGNGNPLINTEVKFNINGVFYIRNTNGSGIARLNIALDSGKYILTAIHPNGEMFANNITVLSTINSGDMTKYFKNGTQYYATFYDDSGNPLINTTVRFNINGVIYERITNDKGTAMLTIALYPGSYILTAIHPNGESKGYNIKVLSTLIDNKDINMYYVDGTAFTIKVLDGQGKPLANTTVNFNINGVLYGRVTDENGIAKLNIKLYPNNYIITSSYNGLEVSNRINVSSSNTTIIGKDAHVIMDSINSNYTVTLVDVKGNPIGNKTVYFRYDNKQVTATTDKNGNATITISGLKNGDYNITYGFDGVEGYCSSSSSSILHVVNSTTILTGNDLTMVYNDGSEFKVKLTDLYGKPLANKIITFVINGIAYNRTTDSNGVASLNIRLDPGNYLISYYYSNKGALDYNNGSNNVIITKQTLNVEGKDLVMLPKDGSAFEVKITDKNKKPVKDIAVLFTISGVTYTRYTDQSGVAKLNINLNVGYYTISYAINDTFCQGSGSNMILVNGTIITADDININAGTNGTFSVKLTDAKGNPISGASIKFYYEGITKNAITNAEGIATITVDPLGKGDYPIAYYYPTIGGNYSNSGQSYIHVSGTISIANIIDASKVVKSFIESEGKLPDSVLINGESYTLAQFLYLAAIATININNGDFSDLDSKDAANPDNYNKCGNLGNLVDYISVAQSIIDYVNANGKAPGSVPSNVGTITFDGLVYAFARVVAFYGNNQQLPAYVTIKSIDSESSQFVINRVNVKATESELANINTYLQPTANCQVNDPTIVALAQRLTAGLSTPTQKASAILDYVIDNIAYAGYYDTTRGAKKTLTDKRGNCCDQAHLVIALFRAADLPARYVHGTCTFSSGPIGHVWAQVLIGDTWVVADPVSSRNSLGVIKNWNINTFTFKSYYTSLPF